MGFGGKNYDLELLKQHKILEKRKESTLARQTLRTETEDK